MIIILKKEAAESQVNGLISLLESKNIQPHVSRGSLQTIVGCVGDVSRLDPGILEALDGVESVQRIQEPFKAANRKFHPEDTVVDCSGVKVGGGSFSVIAGPCSVESEEQIVAIAKSVKGDAYKEGRKPISEEILKKIREGASYKELGISRSCWYKYKSTNSEA